MANPFGALSDLKKLQAQAQQMQQALQKEQVTVERNGVKVVVRGDQQVLEIEIDGIVERRVVDAINEAVKKTQELAAKKLMAMSQEQG